MKFLCDSMLGKLSRLLRMCGFDAEYCKKGLTLEDLKKIRDKGLVILTRNRKLLNFDQNLLLFNPDNDIPLLQLKMVLDHFNLKSHIKFLSRCMECNVEIVNISKAEVKGKVPFYVYDNHEDFFQCPSCGRIYWEGSHVGKMREKLERILK